MLTLLNTQIPKGHLINSLYQFLTFCCIYFPSMFLYFSYKFICDKHNHKQSIELFAYFETFYTWHQTACILLQHSWFRPCGFRGIALICVAPVHLHRLLPCILLQQYITSLVILGFHYYKQCWVSISAYSLLRQYA